MFAHKSSIKINTYKYTQRDITKSEHRDQSKQQLQQREKEYDRENEQLAME